jgi:protein-S-isoprenylcysteine O-methyltransferase Ste14
MSDNIHTAGIAVRPPKIFLAFLAAGTALDLAFPAPAVPPVLRLTLGPLLLGVGVGLMGAAMRRFRRAETPVETCKATSALVTEGPFRFSRNPIYLAGFALYLGAAVAAGGVWTLALFVPFFLVIRHAVVAREERYLRDRFGAAYETYRAAVPRWLGRPRTVPGPETAGA